MRRHMQTLRKKAMKGSWTQFQCLTQHQSILRPQWGIQKFNSIKDTLCRDSIRPPQVSAQFYKTALPAHFRCQSQAPTLVWASDPLTMSQRFPRCPLWVQLICQGSFQFQLLTRPQFFNKEYNSEIGIWKGCTGQAMGKGTQLPCPLQSCQLSPNLHMLINLENSFRGFKEVSLHKYN